MSVSLWELLSANYIKPDTITNSNAWKEWSNKDNTITFVIITTFDASLHHLMSDNTNTASTIWNRLKANYATESTLSMFLKFKKYFSMTLDDSKPLSEQLELYGQLWKEISDSGILTNSKLLRTFGLLASLPDSYNNLVEPILTITKPTDIKFDDIWAKITTEESCHIVNIFAFHSPNSLSNSASKNSKRKDVKKRKGKCNYCHKEGH